MSLTLVSSGTVALSVSAEITVVENSVSAHSYVFGVDVSLSIGDRIEINLLTRISSGASYISAYFASYAHTQASPMTYSIPVPAHAGFQVRMKQTDGDARSLNWILLALDQA